MDKNRWLIELHSSPKSCFGKAEWSTFSAAEKVFDCVWQLEAEVNNGGFVQYFRNGSGEHADKVVTALETIGAFQTAGIVLEALAVFPGCRSPSDAVSRCRVLDQVPSKQLDDLSAINQKFLRYPDDLTELLYEFVQRNRREIRGA